MVELATGPLASCSASSADPSLAADRQSLKPRSRSWLAVYRSVRGAFKGDFHESHVHGHPEPNARAQAVAVREAMLRFGGVHGRASARSLSFPRGHGLAL